MHSLLRLRKFDLFRKIVDILSLVKRNILLSPLEGEKKFLSELCELRNFREGYKKYKTLDRATKCAIVCVGDKKGKIKMNKNNLQQKQPNNPVAFPETNYSQFTTHHSLKRKSAFTLAEVLITLGIIGVVASLTLPTLIENYKEKVMITRIKKDYSVIMQAFQLAQADFGTPNDNSLLFTNAKSNDDLTVAFAKYIPNAKICLTNSKDAICKNLSYKALLTAYKNKYSPINLPVILLPDGGLLQLTRDTSSKCVDTPVSGVLLDADGNLQYNEDGTVVQWHQIRNICGDIDFDVNGVKEPNKYGYDIFKLTVFPNKIGKGYWDVFGVTSLYSILQGGKLKYNKN